MRRETEKRGGDYSLLPTPVYKGQRLRSPRVSKGASHIHRRRRRVRTFAVFIREVPATVALSHGRASEILSKNEHTIAVAVKAIALFDRMAIRIED